MVGRRSPPRSGSGGLSGVEVRILSPGGGAAAVGSTGEVVVRSEYVFDHYLGTDGATPDRAGWFLTGDLGSMDESGRLRVVGRAQAVHRGGMTLYPASIEQAADLEGIPLVVVTLPDERMGAHLTGVVEDPLREPAAKWKARLRAFLTAHEVPDRVMIVESFPMLSNGKIDRSYLTESARSARLSARHDSGVQPIGVGRSAPEFRGTVRGTTT